MRSGLYNRFVTRVLVLLVTGLLLTMIGSQIYRYLNDRHDTQEAVLATINEDIDFTGVIIRDETPLTYNGSDVVSYVYSDGSKVSKGDAVAQLFDSQEAANAEKKLRRVNEQIELLKRAQNPGTTDYVQPESISNKIDEHYKHLMSFVNKGEYGGFETVKNDMSLVMNIYNIISGTTTDYNSRIALLESKAAELSAQAASANGTVNASKTGYFVSYCDGFESRLTTAKAENLTISDVEGIISDRYSGAVTPPAGSVGKLFEEYSCLIAGVIDADPRVVEDATLKLTLDSTDNVYKVTVKSVKKGDDGKWLVIFSCGYLDEYIASSRIQSMQLIFDEYSGIKVPRSAIRFRGEDKGVYVILGEDITFKKIDVIYEGDDFVISKNTSQEDHLLLYDQILLEVVSEQDVGIKEPAADSDVSRSGGESEGNSSEGS